MYAKFSKSGCDYAALKLTERLAHQLTISAGGRVARVSMRRGDRPVARTEYNASVTINVKAFYVTQRNLCDALNGQVALVIGANAGIGKATATGLQAWRNGADGQLQPR